jgi:hypothetical protein
MHGVFSGERFIRGEGEHAVWLAVHTTYPLLTLPATEAEVRHTVAISKHALRIIVVSFRTPCLRQYNSVNREIWLKPEYADFTILDLIT